jgi:hypothetical protein
MKKLIPLLLLFVTLNGCKKEEHKHIKEVSYHCYTDQGKAVFKYVDRQGSWVTLPLNRKTTDLTIETNEDDYHFIPSLVSTGPDSLFLSASCNGKSTENKFRSAGGTNTITVELEKLR